MTTKEADRLIKTGEPVVVVDPAWGIPFRAVFTSRDRTTISTDSGKWLRSPLVVLYGPKGTHGPKIPEAENHPDVEPVAHW